MEGKKVDLLLEIFESMCKAILFHVHRDPQQFHVSPRV